jgi:hypothetical protein
MCFDRPALKKVIHDEQQEGLIVIHIYLFGGRGKMKVY